MSFQSSTVNSKDTLGLSRGSKESEIRPGSSPKNDKVAVSIALLVLGVITIITIFAHAPVLISGAVVGSIALLMIMCCGAYIISRSLS